MLDRFIIHKQDNEALTRAISQGVNQLSETIEAATDKEVGSRDRVNISLKEYKNLARKVELLESENSRYKQFFKELDVPCPDCGNKIVIRKGRNRTVFYSCSSYPKCNFTSCDTPTNEKCPDCGKMLLRKRGKNLNICIDKECGYKAETNETGEES